MMKALHHGLLRRACKLWLHWDPHIRLALNMTRGAEGFEQSEESDGWLFAQWQGMIRNCIMSWERYVGISLVAVEQNLDGDVGDGQLEPLEEDKLSDQSSDSEGDAPNA